MPAASYDERPGRRTDGLSSARDAGRRNQLCQLEPGESVSRTLSSLYSCGQGQEHSQIPRDLQERVLPDPESACASFFSNDIESLATQISLCENDLQKDYLSYVIKHFNHTKPWHNSDYICCAAENVVSHVFNNRMRSIPRTWGCNIFKMSSGLALMNTNNLDISLTSISDDKLLNKYTSISDLFLSISFEK